MAFNEKIADRIREGLAELPNVVEKFMFGGVCFMVNGKMCIGVIKEDMMCRIDPVLEEGAIEKRGCRPMDFTGRPMKGYVYVSEEGLRTRANFDYWINLCLDFNTRAKAAKKPKNKKSK